MLMSLALALWATLIAPQASPASQAPAPLGTTPGACLKEVRDDAAKRRAEVPAPPASPTAEATQQRAQLLRQIDGDRLAMAKACAAKFDVKTTEG